ncbi:L-talarate/galactarate dehydratase [Pseudoprimorskyibacter insulae]|uniref:L-talarate/galactarate dehydratase n=1 Tax=Pseudoprimorskyibacter insulae TaxID=1695997 RepID=A0A2R8AVI3_9RHOB|nr:mandelate racemase/muconate lactonizing enzyme family protein [Pseudoprimorskyibacter insulae]SPF80042.1 L-talarate/galactarate dehydratase [Pseudoprimorskyibacter insulae]
MPLDLSRRRIAARTAFGGAARGKASQDAIAGLKVSHILVPFPQAISDAKVLTGRQKPLDSVDILLVEAVSEAGQTGLGYGYTLRNGGAAQFALAAEIAPALIGEDPNDIDRLWEKLRWQVNSLGRGGLGPQVIAAFDTALWDMKAKRAGLPLAKLFGAHRDTVRIYNSDGQYLQASVDEMKAAADTSLASGIGGIKMKVGQPDGMIDLRRIDAMRSHLPDDIPLMIDANQQWDRAYALQFGRIVDDMGLGFIEEPLDALDFEGHAMLADNLATPIATGEMLTSTAEAFDLIRKGGCDICQTDAPRIGGVTPFLKVMAMAEACRVDLAPHWMMELQIHLAAAYPEETWVEHFHMLEPLFNERLDIENGRVAVPDRPGLGLSITGQGRDWTRNTVSVGNTHGI